MFVSYDRQMLKGRGFFLCALLALGFLAIFYVSPAAAQYGCYKGYCWSWCGDKESGSWCYTTKGRKLDEGWVGCGSPADCNEEWQCANTCHPKDYT